MIEFKIGERVVGTTRSTRQVTICRILAKLAAQYLGETVTVHYPEESRPADA